MDAEKMLRAKPMALLNAPLQEPAGPASGLAEQRAQWLWCPGARGASAIPVGSPRTSGRQRTSSAVDFSCHHPTCNFPC